MQEWKPKDAAALTIISGLILFKLTGHNGSFDAIVALIVGYYFAHRNQGIDKGI